MVKREKPGRRRPKQKCPQRARRYTAEQKTTALAWAAKHGPASAAAKFGMSQRTVDYWQAAQRKGPASEAGARAAKTVASGTSSPSAPAVTAAPAVKGSLAARGRRGRRYGVVEKQAVLAHATAHGATATEQALGVSRWSIYEWRRRQAAAPTGKAAAQALAPRSSRPKHNAQTMSEERHQQIADAWLANQALGPRQVRNQLRRTRGLRVGTSTVRRVMLATGYVPPKITVERKSVRRYEAVRPNQQLHLDFVQFFVHKAKVYLLFIEDDYSRFLVGWALCEGERAQPVVEELDCAIARHGRPEQVVVDGGSGFFSWRGESQLERVCADYGIDFIKASKGGANGKLEALNGNVRKELLSRVEFADLADARKQVAAWVRGYNLERPHEGLGGLLVPADRFFGRVEEVTAQLERGAPVVVPGLGLETRPLELFRVISRGGRPELWLLGERIWPPAQTTA